MIESSSAKREDFQTDQVVSKIMESYNTSLTSKMGPVLTISKEVENGDEEIVEFACAQSKIMEPRKVPLEKSQVLPPKINRIGTSANFLTKILNSKKSSA